LLHVRRAEARDYLIARDEAWRDDASNLDTAIVRNRVRHELMPVLESVAPGAAVVLARTARLAQDDESFLMEAAIKNRPALVVSEEGSGGPVELDAGTLSLLPPCVGTTVNQSAGGSGRAWSRSFGGPSRGCFGAGWFR
jgi:tRNA(Ile)-lysidine synthase